LMPPASMDRRCASHSVPGIANTETAFGRSFCLSTCELLHMSAAYVLLLRWSLTSSPGRAKPLRRCPQSPAASLPPTNRLIISPMRPRRRKGCHERLGDCAQEVERDRQRRPCRRFMIRQGQRGLMVWDREAKGPAKIDGRQAVGLTEQQAADIKTELTQSYAPRE
jgi:hypothetical protein